MAAVDHRPTISPTHTHARAQPPHILPLSPASLCSRRLFPATSRQRSRGPPCALRLWSWIPMALRHFIDRLPRPYPARSLTTNAQSNNQTSLTFHHAYLPCSVVGSSQSPQIAHTIAVLSSLPPAIETQHILCENPSGSSSYDAKGEVNCLRCTSLEPTETQNKTHRPSVKFHSRAIGMYIAPERTTVHRSVTHACLRNSPHFHPSSVRPASALPKQIPTPTAM